MSRNVFFSPSKANNFYLPSQNREVNKPELKPFQYKPTTSEVYDKSKPFSEVTQKLRSDSSLNSLGLPKVKESLSQNPKIGLYRAAEAQYTKKSPQFNGKLQPIAENNFNKAEVKQYNSPVYFEGKKKNISPELVSENGVIDGLYNNQTNYTNKIKKLERVQEMRQKAFEGSVYSSTKAKDDQLNSLIEKRIKERNLIEEKMEAEKKFKIQQQKMELNSFIKDQMAENPKNAELVKKQDSGSWERIKIIEEMRKKKQSVPEKVESGGAFEQNTLKFFGCDVEENELPGSSTFKYDIEASKLSPIRFGKTNIRNTTYNPITDSVNTYDSSRNNVRGLGSKKSDGLPTKVNELSPPKNTEYYSNRTKGYEITNPLTGEIKKVEKMLVTGVEEGSRFRFVIK